MLKPPSQVRTTLARAATPRAIPKVAGHFSPATSNAHEAHHHLGRMGEHSPDMCHQPVTRQPGRRLATRPELSGRAQPGPSWRALIDLEARSSSAGCPPAVPAGPCAPAGMPTVVRRFPRWAPEAGERDNRRMPPVGEGEPTLAYRRPVRRPWCSNG